MYMGFAAGTVARHTPTTAVETQNKERKKKKTKIAS
jgi:hypothetical protein